jgi:hypothetical protein
MTKAEARQFTFHAILAGMLIALVFFCSMGVVPPLLHAGLVPVNPTIFLGGSNRLVALAPGRTER